MTPATDPESLKPLKAMSGLPSSLKSADAIDPVPTPGPLTIGVPTPARPSPGYHTMRASFAEVPTSTPSTTSGRPSLSKSSTAVPYGSPAATVDGTAATGPNAPVGRPSATSAVLALGSGATRSAWPSWSRSPTVRLYGYANPARRGVVLKETAAAALPDRAPKA